MGNSQSDYHDDDFKQSNDCSFITEAVPLYKMNGIPVGIFRFGSALLYLLFSFLIIYWIKKQEKNAKENLLHNNDEDNEAVQSVIFPVFVQVLWANTFVNVYVGIVLLLFNFSATYIQTWGAKVAFSLVWAGKHAIVEGIAFLLMQKGLGTHAAKEVGIRVLIWAIITFVVKTIYYASPDINLAFSVNFIWALMLWFFYLALWITPGKRLFRRPAAIFYAKFWFIFVSVNLIATMLTFSESTMLDGSCIEVVGTTLLFGIFEPLIAYYTLILDSRWWQGFDSNKVAQSDIRSPLAGIDLNLASAQNLARSMDNMGAVLTSGGSGIRLLNFAYCEIDLKQKIGEGSFSKVYKGKYRQQACAIKVVFTVDLTREVINRAAAEAKILSAMKHPNIVNIFGVSVNPPSICILLEMCEFGSLANVVGGNGINFFQGGRTVISMEGPEFKLCNADRLFLAVGCARGLNALHSMSSTLCHRDIKSFNFLVDKYLVVKLADLELGDNDDKVRSKDRDNRMSTISNLSISDSENANNIQERGSSQSNRDDIKFDKDVLANWIAPEVLSGDTYTQASDIYSFTLVLWEIISGEQPFASIRKQDAIRKQILKGSRPYLPQVDGGSWQKYIALISRGWQHDQRFRPSAQEMLCELECMWKECCFKLIVDTDAVPDLSVMSIIATPQKSRLMSGNAIMSSIFGSGPQEDKKIEFSSLDVVAASMQTDPSFSALDADGGAWIIVSADPPYRFLRSTPAWDRLTGLKHQEIIGKPLKDLCVYQVIQEKEINPMDEFQNNLWKMTIDLSDSCHTVLGVHDLDEPDSDMISLYSLHAFPIRKRTPSTGLPIRKTIPSSLIPRYSVGSIFGTSPSPSTSISDNMSGKFALDKVTIPAPATPVVIERISEDFSPPSIPFSQAHPVTLIAILFSEIKSKEVLPAKSYWREIRASRSTTGSENR